MFSMHFYAYKCAPLYPSLLYIDDARIQKGQSLERKFIIKLKIAKKPFLSPHKFDLA